MPRISIPDTVKNTWQEVNAKLNTSRALFLSGIRAYFAGIETITRTAEDAESLHREATICYIDLELAYPLSELARVKVTPETAKRKMKAWQKRIVDTLGA